jgi:hypothetical protein
MCFVLYAGTTTALPRKTFDIDAPGLTVESLTEREAAIKRYFSSPEVQYVGSTSGCGCDFPHAMLQNGQWPIFENTEKDELDTARDASDRRNQEALVALLRTTGDKMVELYGTWDGGNEAFDSPPQAHEEISVQELLDPAFHFKERGFYKVHLENSNPAQKEKI